MRNYLIGVAAVVGISLAFSAACRKDIVLEPLPTLAGTYLGNYNVITNYQTPSQSTITSTIQMRFTDENYWFDSDNLPDDFCSPSGNYLLTANNIELDESNKNCAGVVANEKDNPRGMFSIRLPADSIIMLQQDTVTNTFKQVYLKKK